MVDAWSDGDAGALISARRIVAERPLAPPTRRATGHGWQSAPLTPLIGRAADLKRLTALLGDRAARLVTLVGPGGSGKTRLAIAAAEGLAESFPDGVAFVDLTPLTEPGLVIPSIARSLGVPDTSGRPITDLLHGYLRDRTLLLVLDNFEQVVDAAPLLADLLSACPGVTALVTSRAALHVRGEREIDVLPLPLPTLEPFPTLDQLARNPAVALFVACAQTIRSDFLLTDGNAPDVAAICIRLDGLPLAIELAAARIKLFAPTALLTRLESRLSLLTGGARDLPARQRTLRDTIAWSHQLLSPSEQTLFRRLSVFVGGCTIEAAEAASTADTTPAADVVDGIASLVEQSLLRQWEGSDGEMRFSMLETTREYAQEQLAASGEHSAVRSRHLHWCLALAERSELELRGTDPVTWLDRLDLERDNLRAALRWATASSETEAGLRLAGALWFFWLSRGYLGEGTRWLDDLLAQPGTASPAARAKAMNGAAPLHFVHGSGEKARALSQECVDLCRSLGEPWGTALALQTLAHVEGTYGADHDRALLLFEEALDLARHVQDDWLLAIILVHFVVVFRVARPNDPERLAAMREEGLAYARRQGNQYLLMMHVGTQGLHELENGQYRRATVFLEEGAALARYLGDDDSHAFLLLQLGRVAVAEGAHKQATTTLGRALTISRDHSLQRDIVLCLEVFGDLAAARQLLERAGWLFGAAEALRDRVSFPMPPPTRSQRERVIARVHAAGNGARFDAAYAAGRELTADQAIAEAWALVAEVERAPLPTPPPETPAPAVPVLPPPASATVERADSARASPLSPREVEVLRLVTAGKTNLEIAAALSVSVFTVNRHVSNILTKIGAVNRVEAAAYAHQHNLL